MNMLKKILLSLDFKKGADHFINSSLGQWKVTNGAYWQDEAVAGRTTSVSWRRMSARMDSSG